MNGKRLRFTAGELAMVIARGMAVPYGTIVQVLTVGPYQPGDPIYLYGYRQSITAPACDYMVGQDDWFCPATDAGLRKIDGSEPSPGLFESIDWREESEA